MNNRFNQNDESVWSLKVLEYVDQGFSVFDQDLNLVAWNKRFFELLELPESLMQINQNIEPIFRFNAERGEYGEGDIDELVAQRIALAKTFTPHVFDRIRPDGTIIEVRGNPMPAEDGRGPHRGFVTTYTDVTQQRITEAALESHVEKRTLQLKKESLAHKKTAQALRESEIWLRQITDAVPALIAYIDCNDRYQFTNKKHQEWFGFRKDQLIGVSIFDVVEECNQAQLAHDLTQVHSGISTQSEYQITSRDNTQFDVSITLIPHFDATDRFAGYFFLGQDLTEYKHAQKTLLESQKMQALGQMTGGIAHDFNNLLTIILGNLNLLEDSTFNRNEANEITHSCIQAAKRGSDLIQRLLTFSKQQSLEPQSTNINALIEDFVVLLQRTIGEQVHIESDLESGIEPALIDPNQLQSCLINLTLNAKDAMPNGGKITIRTESIHISPIHSTSNRINTDLLNPGQYISLSVEDQGHGMSPETIRRAFEPFYTTKPSGVGTGLGLSMVYGFVTQSGGEVRIHSKIGKGTKIKLNLPVTPGSLTGTSPAHTPQPPSVDTRALQVLLVEDDDEVRRYVRRALSNLGYQITEAQNGEQAMGIIESMGIIANKDSKIDIILTDIVMPGQISGIDLYHYASTHLPATKVLCMTGYSEQLDGKISRQNLIKKPFEIAQLSTKLKTLLSTPTHVR